MKDIQNIDEIFTIPIDNDGTKRIIDLDKPYTGHFEYEGNVIPISRMFIEYYKEDYYFYPTQIFNKEGKQMYIYANSNSLNEQLQRNPNLMYDLAMLNIKWNFSLREYVNRPEECYYDFWWDIEGDYLILFGEEKKELINFFINEYHQRDGGKEGIKRKLLANGYGYKIQN